MSAVAGWYPDPEGDTSRLRYWDGTQWTDNYTPIPTAAPAEDPQVAQAAAYTAQPTPAAPVTSDTSYQVFDSEQIYPMTSQDRVLRLIAFILNIISCVGWAWLIIPLAWMIPMTVISHSFLTRLTRTRFRRAPLPPGRSSPGACGCPAWRTRA